MSFTDIDAARAALSNPTLPPEELMSIAQSYPELRIGVAQHPNAYPDLLVWLSSVGDDTVRRTIDQRGVSSDSASAPPSLFTPKQAPMLKRVLGELKCPQS